MTTPPLRLRDLNDYESMLATSTCNVGILLTLPHRRREECESNLRQAWTRTVQERRQLQVKLVVKEGDMGSLGQRYGLAEIPLDHHPSLFQVVQTQVPALINGENTLLTRLQHIGTTALDISKASYTVVCFLDELDTATEEDICTTTQSVQIIISLCHALSDGPGALRVARSFLEHVGHVLDEQESSPVHSSTIASTVQPLVDLQAQLLGADYVKQEPEQTYIFEGQQDFTEALRQQQQQRQRDTILLPVEAMQTVPTDAGFGTEPSVIDCVHFSLAAHETATLRTKCREHSTTVQGALAAAALKARLTLLGHLSRDNDARRILAAVQIPVNTRSIAHVDDDICLCGSAGVWHTVTIPLPTTTTATTWWDIAQESTQRIRAALHENNSQHVREWLRRLFHAPATLPPYSIMVSSIGVAPIESSYGQHSSVQVNQLHFFGASLRTQQPSQAVGSMMHAVTFRDEFHCLFNFTSPGISKAFAKRTVEEIKETLLSFAAS